MTSDYVIVVPSTSCPEVGNDEHTPLLNLGGRSMSSFGVIEGCLWTPSPLPRSQQVEKKETGLNRIIQILVHLLCHATCFTLFR